ncbi:hypothetical protein HOLleu_42447 [Holothuria leucospilota]|uniref:Uncharacterized protein n=1 Tax=Holothuria leucospilota TaxID=206669 RepID=A0A9Q1BC62_HOLLE|nr:hypothetical protein HOLleu_42447 [Holothuria leucospilota]
MCALCKCLNFFKGGKGRPKVTIPLNQQELLYQQGYTASQKAKVFKCPKSVVYKTCYKNNIKFRDRYSNITDSALERAVAGIYKKKNPNSGTEV